MRWAQLVIVVAVLLASVVSADTTVYGCDISVGGQSMLQMFQMIDSHLQNISSKMPKTSSDGAGLCEPVLYDKIRTGDAY